MPQSEQTQVQCRLAETSADASSVRAYVDFCAFEFPGCDDCPNGSSRKRGSEAAGDPLKSVALSGWLHGELYGPR